MRSDKHKYLVIPGPVEVRPEILDAQAQWMIGHRSAAFADLFARLQEKLRAAFFTGNRVFISGSSGTGLWEGASRNCIRDGQKALHLVGGAFSEKWAEVSRLNGKEADVLEVPWGQAHTPEMVADALKAGHYDAVCVVHNEPSTGVTNPIAAISEAVHRYDDTLLLVDTVSGFLGAELRVDEWGIDMALASTQKAFALPPGMAVATISPRPQDPRTSCNSCHEISWPKKSQPCQSAAAAATASTPYHRTSLAMRRDGPGGSGAARLGGFCR